MPHADPDRRKSYNRDRQERISWRARMQAQSLEVRAMMNRLPPWLTGPRAEMPESTRVRVVRVMPREDDE